MPKVDNSSVKQLEKTAQEVRKNIVKILTQAGSGHTAGSLGLADIFTAFYFNLLNHRPRQPGWKDRDRLILSNGHVCPARYAAMAEAGYFSKDKLLTLRQLGSPLQGHPEIDRLPGVETTSGPLGEGTSEAVGLACAAKMDKVKWRVYCILSDGELQEGQTWEAFMFAAKYKLDNCLFILDRNHIQISGDTEKVMPLEPLTDKFKAFNLHVEECDGNNIENFVLTVKRCQKIKNRSSIIIANTIPGKGVNFMENQYEWHGKTPNPEEMTLALKELKK